MYDLAIIGAGWAGFNAALRAKELGLAVCLIDAHQLGGTCLNSGCIPTKTLISCAKIFSLAKKSSSFGVELDNLRFNWVAIQEKKNKVVRQLGLGMQSKLTGIDFIQSLAQIISAREIKVADRIINAKFILIATGSHPIQLPGVKFDREKIISSDEALALTQVPRSLLVIGGGVIGCEFASLFSILGTQVALAERMPLLLPTEDKDISRKIEVVFKKNGIEVLTGIDISTLDLEKYSQVLVCVGRAPNIQGLGLEDLGVQLKDNRITVDDYLRTNLDNIYAAGDCTAKIMLAHYAAYQGVAAVENMFTADKQKADNSVVPNCIFTAPQIASVGVKENGALADGRQIKVHKFDFRASAMAQIIDETEGFIKIVTDQKTGQVIGASIIGAQATELIATLTVAIDAHLTASQLRRMIFAHPTFSESLGEALKDRGGGS
jgi:dihydrolipoamide dehydrogenase